VPFFTDSGWKATLSNLFQKISKVPKDFERNSLYQLLLSQNNVDHIKNLQSALKFSDFVSKFFFQSSIAKNAIQVQYCCGLFTVFLEMHKNSKVLE